MKKITLHNKTIYLGIHTKLGAFIYDKARQTGVGTGMVKLFSIEKKSSAIYQKSIIKENIRVVDDETYTKLVPNIAKYFELASSKRDTHCFKCKKKLNSLDFATCPQCHWIKCKCGACGCVPGYKI